MWIIFAALFPLTGIAVWQGNMALEDSRNFVAARLRANAWNIAESQRDPFIIAQHSLSFAAETPDVRDMTARCGTVLANAMQGATGLLNFVRTDANGKAQCSVLPFIKGQDLSKDPWLVKRGTRKGLYLADPQIGTVSKRAVHIMVLPLFRPNGDFDGTLSAGISIEQLTASLQMKQQTLSGAIFVADASGKPFITTNRSAVSRFTELRAAINNPKRTATPHGEEWIYVSAPLYRDELYIVYAERETLVTRAATARIWPSLLLLLLALLFTSIAVWFATQRLILRWLVKLQKMTARFASGDFRSEITEYADAPTELAEFAGDLHYMASEIDAQKHALREALEAKTALTKEVNHRVKNNLQIVSSLLSLQTERVTDPAAKLALGQAKLRIASLGMLHRLLFESDGGGGVGRVNMHRLMTELCSQLRNSYRDRPDVFLTCKSTEISLPADKAIPLTLFTVEAISNAFQHAFAVGSGGAINADLSVEGTNAVLTISDDGRGFIEAAVIKHMGSNLLQAFAQPVSGTVNIESPPSGTAVKLSFQLPT